MADLRINDINKTLLARLKIAAIKAGKTLRQFVLDILAEAVTK
jgi:hypothetical protein